MSERREVGEMREGMGERREGMGERRRLLGSNKGRTVYWNDQRVTTSPNPTYQMELYRETASLNFRYEKALPVIIEHMQGYMDEFEDTYITENDMFELDEAYSRVKELSSKKALTVEKQFDEVEGK